ncbi:MAG: pantoate--beta-alanine ligase, partial [Pseudomonadota bacterium]|nr:pantoate--beta-alanine ligase [Pseudomonadota bacterium]
MEHPDDMILHLPDPTGARRWCSRQRASQRSIGFVPTMGALHEGHLSLVRRSLEENGVTCASIFVNPLQFNDSGDFSNYPKDIDSDLQLLQEIGCDMVFSGTLGQFFPEAEDLDKIELADPGPHALGLEGAHRPSHFHGVRAICERLFRTVGPGRAYF